MKFLRVSRNIVLALQFLTLVSVLLGSTMLIFHSETIRKYNWGGLTFLPQNERVLEDCGEIDIRFIPDPNIDVHLVINETSVQMNAPLPQWRFTIWVFFITLNAIVYIILMQLGRMIKTVEDGDPFNKWNIKRIYFLAILMASFPVAGRILGYLYQQWLTANFQVEGLVLSTQSSDFIPWLLSAILLATIGKIVERGM